MSEVHVHTHIEGEEKGSEEETKCRRCMPLVQERERKEGEKESGNRGRHTKKGREKGREGGGEGNVDWFAAGKVKEEGRVLERKGGREMWIGLQLVR